MKQENNSRKKCVSDGEIKDSRSLDGMTEFGCGGAVTNPKNMKAADFPRNGGTNEFLKSVVRGYFPSKHLDPSDPNLNKRKTKK